MSIIFARVDDRLIHGQVVQGWLPVMDVNSVAVVAPHMGGLKFAMLMRMALPQEYDLHHGTAEEMAQYLKTSEQKIFLLIFSLKEALELVNLGVELKYINIGGVHFSDGKTEVCDNFFLNEEEKTILKKLASMNIEIDCRAVPKAVQSDILGKI